MSQQSPRSNLKTLCACTLCKQSDGNLLYIGLAVVMLVWVATVVLICA